MFTGKIIEVPKVPKGKERGCQGTRTKAIASRHLFSYVLY